MKNKKIDRNQVIEKIKKISTSKKIFAILGVIFTLTFFLNVFTPLIADDYSYSFGVNGRIKNILDIIQRQYQLYFTWGGRNIAHAIANFFLMMPKMIFNVCNSLVFVAFILLIYLHARKDKEDNLTIFVLIPILLWFFCPVFGQTFIWLIGSCNYLWTTTIILAFLLFYRKDEAKTNHKYLKVILMLLLGIIAGWTNENTSFGLIIAVLGFLFFDKFVDKKKIPSWKYSGLLGAIIGFLIMILAPGNYVRADVATKSKTSFIATIIKRFISYTQSSFTYLMPFFIILIVLITILIYNRKKIEREISIYLAASFFSIYSMLLSPTFPPRAWTGVIIFFIIPIVMLLFECIKNDRLLKTVLLDIVLISLLFCARDYLKAVKEIRALNAEWNWRIEYMETQKKNGNKEIVVPKFRGIKTKYNPNYLIVDIGPEQSKDIWPNNVVARYYGINHIYVDEDLTKKDLIAEN